MIVSPHMSGLPGVAGLANIQDTLTIRRRPMPISRPDRRNNRVCAPLVSQGTGAVPAREVMEMPVVTGEGNRLEQRMVVEYGVTLDGVWLPLAMLRRLGTHGPWAAPFTEANADQERVLLAHALAERHNRSGLHRGIGLSGFLDAVPYEPTEPFSAPGM
jgi:hypothetical protein